MDLKLLTMRSASMPIAAKKIASTALRVSIRYTNKIKGVPGADVQKHAEILDTIKSRNPERAKKAVEAILDEALELIESRLE